MKNIFSFKCVGYWDIGIVIAEILYLLLDVFFGGKTLPFGWLTEISSILVLSLFDLIFVIIIGILINFIFSLIKKGSISDIFLLSIIIYEIIKHLCLKN